MITLFDPQDRVEYADNHYHFTGTIAFIDRECDGALILVDKEHARHLGDNTAFVSLANCKLH